MSCPQNPNHEISATEIKQPDIKEVIRIASESGWEGCPNCLLSIIIPTGIQTYPYHLDWDYQQELKDIWTDINEDKT